DIDSTYEFKGSGFSLSYKIDNVSLEFNLKEDGYPLSIVPIPNGRFPNSGFQIVLKNVTNDTTVTKKTVGSLWPDMPVSLLNLDVAIDMLRFIVSDSKLKEMKSGNAVEKEKKFREFWAERDPTPDTEFNELMVEYYDRIDYAYKEYTTPQNPGFNTDQGRAYILFGEPNDIERRLPTNAPTREIWYYDNRTLVFEATTGFGDFKLIGEQ
ncbi:MAG: GWxTD domain-containing protein, partial [Balneolaceae bacterium]